MTLDVAVLFSCPKGAIRALPAYALALALRFRARSKKMMAAIMANNATTGTTIAVTSTFVDVPWSWWLPVAVVTPPVRVVEVCVPLVVVDVDDWTSDISLG
jgi:hypothetical protein